MIVIYTQEDTIVKNDLNDACECLIKVYGKKLTKEANRTLSGAPEGTVYQKFGGPRVEIVSREKAAWIQEKEAKLKL